MSSSSYFKVPNNIFELGLKPNDLMVYTYMLSINRYKNNRIYKTLAKECNISVATAVNTINSLCQKNLIKKINRYSRYDGGKIANCYIINHINNADNHQLRKHYFIIYREDMKTVIKYGKSVFSVYLYMQKTKSKKYSYPSLTTIQNNCVIKSRMLVIDCIKKLEQTGMIKKINRKSKKNNSYITNKYTHINIPKIKGKVCKEISLFDLIDLDDSIIFTIVFFYLSVKNIITKKVCILALYYIKFP